VPGYRVDGRQYPHQRRYHSGASPAGHSVKLAANHLLDQTANTVADTGLDGIKPIIEKMGVLSIVGSGTVVTFFMTWSPARRFNAERFEFNTPETTPPSIPTNPAARPSATACGRHSRHRGGAPSRKSGSSRGETGGSTEATADTGKTAGSAGTTAGAGAAETGTRR
jgi:hypothetical protein